MTAREIKNCILAAGISEKEAHLCASIIANNSDVKVHITGIQGPTGKSTLCKELKDLGVCAFETWELDYEKLGDINAAYIEIALNKPLS